MSKVCKYKNFYKYLYCIENLNVRVIIRLEIIIFFLIIYLQLIFYSTKDACTEVWGDGNRFNSLSSYCDDGNTSNGDGWSSSWGTESGWNWSGGSTTSKDICVEIWGDGIRYNSITTYWDDGNLVNGDGCNSLCIKEIGWNWLGGSATSKDAWSEICGDSKRFNLLSSYWDDGNILNGDGCNSLWGIEVGWIWTGGSSTSKDSWSEIWGDSKRFNSISTYWDDGNLLNNDGWNSTCATESGWTWSGGSSTSKDVWSEIWGDGKRYNSLSTYCDDGNASNEDGWSSSCGVESGWNWSGGSITLKDSWSEIWGDSKRFNSISTYWDDGNFLNNDGWNSTCVTESGWTWSGGSSTSKDVWSEICGDGKRYNSLSTYCDDGNLSSGDGWNSSWGVESGWSWSGGTSTTADAWNDIWGDSKVVKPASNYWDDGNLVNNDGCNSSWNIENGWTWSGGSISLPSSCSEICGDGIRFNSIATYCDDRNNKSGDGCSSKCSIESGYKWSGGSLVSNDVWSISISTQEAAAAAATQSTVAVGASISSGASLLSMSSPIGVFASVNQFQLLIFIQFSLMYFNLILL